MFRQYLAMNFADPKVIVMPQIGCGIDRLEWEVVSEIIKGVFSETPHVIKIVHK
jgi:Fe-S cluster assembly ATPase SufC